jgi:phospholipase/carboxylesterase
MKFDTEGWFLERGTWGELDGILIAPRNSTPKTLVTLCHGFGAPGTDLVSLAEELVPELPDTIDAPAFLFPKGLMDLQQEYGMSGARAWWLINMARLAQLTAAASYDELANEIPPGIDEARTALEDCILGCLEQKKWADPKLILGGFSQGAMLSVDTALRSNRIDAAGVIAWSGALICESAWAAAQQSNTREFPVFQSHGRQDTVLPIPTGRALHSFLKKLPLPVEYVEFDGPHTIASVSLQGAASLITRVAE